MLRNLAALLFNRHTLVLCGLILLSLVIWFIGPLVYIKPYQPLESENVRWALIAALFVAWFIKLLLQWWRAKRMNDKLLGQLARLTAGRDTPRILHPATKRWRNWRVALKRRLMSSQRHGLAKQKTASSVGLPNAMSISCLGI